MVLKLPCWYLCLTLCMSPDKHDFIGMVTLSLPNRITSHAMEMKVLQQNRTGLSRLTALSRRHTESIQHDQVQANAACGMPRDERTFSIKHVSVFMSSASEG